MARFQRIAMMAAALAALVMPETAFAAGDDVDLKLQWSVAAGPTQIRYRTASGTELEAPGNGPWQRTIPSERENNARLVKVGLLYLNEEAIPLFLRLPGTRTQHSLNISAALRPCNSTNVQSIQARASALTDPDDVPRLAIEIERMLRSTCRGLPGPSRELARALADTICFYSQSSGDFVLTSFADTVGALDSSQRPRLAACQQIADRNFVRANAAEVRQQLDALARDPSPEAFAKAVEAFRDFSELGANAAWRTAVTAENIDFGNYRETLVSIRANQLSQQTNALVTRVTSLEASDYATQLPILTTQIAGIENFATSPAGSIEKDAFERARIAPALSGVRAQLISSQVELQNLLLTNAGQSIVPSGGE